MESAGLIAHAEHSKLGLYGTPFDKQAASALVREIRVNMKSNVTRGVVWRERQLLALERMVVENEEAMAKSMELDLGKNSFTSFTGDIIPIKCAVREARKNLKKWMKPKTVSTNLGNIPGKSKIFPEPYGVVLIISAWNFPLLLSLEPMIGAIAAGNSVVLKPSEIAPSTSTLLVELVEKYLDKDFVRVVEGGVLETSLLLEQKWDKIFFTGSSVVGRVVASAAANHLTPCTLELGGKSPLLLDSTVDLQISANRIAFGKFLNGGQTCTAADYVLVEESVASKLIEKMKLVLVEWFGKEGSPSPDLQRIVNLKQFKRLEAFLKDPSVSEKIVFGGQMDEKNLFIAPTIVRDVPWDSAIMSEEIFGPILPIQTVQSVQEAIQIVNEKPKPLVIYPFTKDKKIAEQIIEETSSGGVCVNDCIVQLTNSSLPFGGVGESGHGKYHGKHSFDCFSHMKSVLYKPFALDLPERYPPITKYKELFIRAIQFSDIWGALLVILRIRK